MTLIRRGCPICGANHTTCGGPSTNEPVDRLAEGITSVSRVQRYRDAKGNVFSLKPEDAERRGGFTLVEAKAVDGPPADKARRARSTKSTPASSEPTPPPDDSQQTPPDDTPPPSA